MPDTDFCPDPKIATKEGGGGEFVVLPFFGATKITKLKIIIFELAKKKLWKFEETII
jgi:hypothetical protein